ncbi:transglycosylase domain-containing protein [Numidum massiliense]|uniref:transglycosylase domain-containing protein n=1 Tax=Numidum massiliense TaxID=1522315 RepID=UPI0006D54A1F|nr:transglycosylase domain-containing protein [Numidum massiliense]
MNAMTNEQTRRRTIERTKEHTKKRTKNRQRRPRRLLAIAIAAVLVALVAMPALGVIGNVLIDDQKLLELERPVFQQQSDSQAFVHYSDMPDYLWQAFIAIEDHRFERHNGVDLQALARALVADVAAGSKAEGGSTITMQLARNVFLSHDKSFSRKLKEIAIAIHLEQRYTKQQLLEMYLNRIYFGHGQYGIEAAANMYFGKTVRAGSADRATITLNEAALLAALPKAPEIYSPRNNFAKAIERRNLVLQRMVDVGFITNAEKEAAMSEDVTVLPAE